MKKLFTISEFAKLRNININSIRYYEKIGVLKPVSIDKKNGYRYYSLNQLSQIDAISLLIDLGIPLKNFSDFINPDDSIELMKLFKLGQKELMDQMHVLQNKIDRVNRALHYINSIKSHIGETDFYTKDLPKRQILTEKIEKFPFHDSRIETSFATIYKKAERKKILPLFPLGLFIDYHEGKVADIRMYTYFVGEAEDKEDIITLPEGQYKCIQIETYDGMNIFADVKHLYGTLGNDCILVENIFSEKTSFNTILSEVQMLIR